MDSAAPTWDLDSVCPGGPGGTSFDERLTAVVQRVEAMEQQVRGMPAVEEDLAGWADLLQQLDPLSDAAGELVAFAVCAAAADARSRDARGAEARADDLSRTLESVHVHVGAAISGASDAAFESLVSLPELASAAPWLRNVRAGAGLRLEPALESLRVQLDREGVSAWGRLYDLLSGDLTAEVVVDGEPKVFGIAELVAMGAHTDEGVRRAAHEGVEGAWEGVADICAHTLTQITGSRQQIQDRLGVDELAESLFDNRLERATLTAMWAATEALRPALVTYLERKAQLLGKDKLDWWDRDAPVVTEVEGSHMAWDEAAGAIADALGGFHGELADFARQAVAKRWIDAAPREGRRPGGFCVDLPQSKQSRIFMTFTGSMDNALTLAHELGHAWHNEVLSGQPSSRRRITSALAETASTFAEATVRDRLIRSAQEPRLKTFMLDQELQAAVAFLMDIPARFGFERQLYALRRRGVFDTTELKQQMVAQQQQAYGGALGSYSELFWCSKLHFYIAEFGFYNWPYTFGYLFSAAVYDRAAAEGPDFLVRLKDLLVRTGWQSTEELAHQTLGVDLTDPAFWIGAAKPIEARVQAFLEATA
ncbi:MAG: hypothetical protein KTR31_16995 [Myxococcales bacterium]|nr:hypothetical protein [Myxococcales bacterium]